MHFAVYGTSRKVNYRDPGLFDKQTGWSEEQHCIPQVCRQTDVMEIGWQLATEEDGAPFGTGETMTRCGGPHNVLCS